MVDPDREPLEGVVEVDQAEIPFRAGDTFFDPGNAGKILIVGAVEVIDRDTNAAKPRRNGAKYLDTRSGRIRLAMIDLAKAGHPDPIISQMVQDLDELQDARNSRLAIGTSSVNQLKWYLVLFCSCIFN